MIQMLGLVDKDYSITKFKMFNKIWESVGRMGENMETFNREKDSIQKNEVDILE